MSYTLDTTLKATDLQPKLLMNVGGHVMMIESVSPAKGDDKLIIVMCRNIDSDGMGVRPESMRVVVVLNRDAVIQTVV